MSETGGRLRVLFEGIAPPIDIAAVMTHERIVSSRRRGVLIAAAAAAVALVVGLGGWLLVGRRGAEPPVITTPPAVTSTTVDSSTTTVAATSLPTEGSLDALGAYAAGPVPSPATCPPGSTPDVPGDPGAPRPPASEMGGGGAAFDRQSGLLVLRGLTTTWVFDPCRNRWEERAELACLSTGLCGPTNWMVYDEDSDLVVAFSGAVLKTYDTETDIWSPLPISSLPGAYGQARYHPPSGLIVLFDLETAGAEGSWAYDVDAAVRLDLGDGLDLGYEPTVPPGGYSYHVQAKERGLVVYDRDGDHWYLYQVAHSDWIPATWAFTPGRGWARVDVNTPSADFFMGDLYTGREIAFDEESGWIALLSRGQLAGFDPTVPAWEILYSASPEATPADGPTYRIGARLVYDSANGRLIMLGGRLGEAPADDVWAYDMANREWILLLAAAQ